MPGLNPAVHGPPWPTRALPALLLAGWADPATSAGPSPALRVRLDTPAPTVRVVHLAGELDTATAPRLAMLLKPLLSTALSLLVLDAGELTFIGLSGVCLLDVTADRAETLGLPLRLITGPRCLQRALHAAELATRFADYPTLDDALATPAKPPRPHPHQQQT